MSVQLLQKLLDEKKWDLCAALAEDLFSRRELTSQEKAFVAFAHCRALSNLDKYSLALEPGQAAWVLAHEAGDYDLLGRSLLELAFVQGHVPGHELYAIETLKKYLTFQDHYSPPLKDRLAQVYFNLAVAERAALRHEEALDHFRIAWEAPAKARDHAIKELYRQDYCWQALTVGDLKLAAHLISLGEAYVKLHPGERSARIHLLMDQARYAYLTGDFPTAIALAMQAIPLAAEADNAGFMASILITWSLACERLGDLDAALGVGMWAFKEAQRSQRPELIAEVRRNVRGVRMQEREVVDRLMLGMLRPA